MATNVLPRVGVEPGRKASQHKQRVLGKAQPPGARKGMAGGALQQRGQKGGTDSLVEQSLLPKDVDPASYHNSIFHNVCLEMLERGFHLSYVELFNLVQHQRDMHRRAGPTAVLLEPLVEYDLTKLEQLRVQLTAAEDAGRAGDYDSVYMCQRSLAEYFDRSGDTWLSDHFYQRCLETGMMAPGANRQKEGEAHCYVGLALENRGSLQKAIAHFETFHQLSARNKWHTTSGEGLHGIACEHLRRVYTSMAEELGEEKKSKEALSYLNKAQKMAQQSGDTHQEGLACYRLGNAYQGIGDSDTALQYHKRYLERSKYHSDHTGMGCAYQALSRVYESKGDVENAVKYLEMYVEVAEQSEAQESLAKAYSAIGAMHNTLGNYELAVEYFGRCYELCCQLGDKEALHQARVQCGIAKGHQLMKGFALHLVEGTCDNLKALVVWKETRKVEEGEGEVVKAEERVGEVAMGEREGEGVREGVGEEEGKVELEEGEGGREGEREGRNKSGDGGSSEGQQLLEKEPEVQL